MTLICRSACLRRTGTKNIGNPLIKLDCLYFPMKATYLPFLIAAFTLVAAPKVSIAQSLIFVFIGFTVG